MNTLTLKIPQSLNDALQLASTRRQISKSALVREALEKSLASEINQTTPASAWVNKWRGALGSTKPVEADDGRLAQILSKHLH